MRLTTMTDYALRLLMYVAQQPDRLCTISEVAQAYAISEAHLMKVTHQLGLQGWIETVRGKGGGMRLAHAPRDINLGAVVRGIEPDFALGECFSTDNQCVLTGQCRLAGVLGGALQEFMAHLDGFSLADLLPGTDLLINLLPKAGQRMKPQRRQVA
ncbi:Rrf2 family transcriptional regulator [Pseudorhodoferax sp. LjRoot39]|uniref:RrF2 family transcriptional regulator n=1 Tax=Pseudorhodoferax sp. LjRoot39 TaxID=3342328 RepID=UPI003ECEE435